jgi:tetratricopeptide (TPR) repeat protein
MGSALKRYLVMKSSAPCGLAGDNRVVKTPGSMRYMHQSEVLMLKFTISVNLIFVLLGLFVGLHVPHMRVHHAIRELDFRGCGISTTAIRSVSRAFMRRRSKTLPLGGVLEDFDAVCDKFLENFLFPEPESIKLATDEQLYDIARFDQVYMLARKLLFSAQRRRHFREGLEWARIAMAARGPGRFHNTSREEWFADSLVDLGMYSDAESVLRNLLPVEMTVGVRDDPKAFRKYRQELLGVTLLGQQKYQEAADILEHSTLEETDFDSLTYYRGIALLGLHRDVEALRAFNSQKNDGQDLYIELCSPKLVDQARKNKVMKLAIKYSEQTVGAIDDVPALELAVQILKIRGFDEAAGRIAEDIRGITQN